MTFVLGLDLDGVVADYTAGFGAFVAAQAGIQVSELPTPTSWNFHQSGWPILDTEHYLRLHAQAVQNALFAEMPVIDDAVEVIEKLRRSGVYVRIMTHRLLTGGKYSQIVTDTVDWLDLHGIGYDDLCFIKDKGDVICDLAIDDSPGNILSFKQDCQKFVIYHQEYNADISGPRVFNWAQAQNYILMEAGLF